MKLNNLVQLGLAIVTTWLLPASDLSAETTRQDGETVVYKDQLAASSLWGRVENLFIWSDQKMIQTPGAGFGFEAPFSRNRLLFL